MRAYLPAESNFFMQVSCLLLHQASLRCSWIYMPFAQMCLLYSLHFNNSLLNTVILMWDVRELALCLIIWSNNTLVCNKVSDVNLSRVSHVFQQSL